MNRGRSWDLWRSGSLCIAFPFLKEKSSWHWRLQTASAEKRNKRNRGYAQARGPGLLSFTPWVHSSVLISSSFMYMFCRFFSTSAVLSYGANTARKTALSVNFQKYSLILFRIMASASESGEGEKPKHTNRLQHSKSPYLLQHKHNPVDWWGRIILKSTRPGYDLHLVVTSVTPGFMCF